MEGARGAEAAAGLGTAARGRVRGADPGALPGRDPLQREDLCVWGLGGVCVWNLCPAPL